MRSIVVSACFVALLIATTSTFAQEWARFRGPNGTGVSQARTIPTTWTEKDFNWKIKLPGGSGHSSPVVWGDKVFVLSAESKTATRYMLCYDANNGKELWQRKYESTSHHLHLRSSFASCTPAVDADHVHVGWSTPKETTLKAFDHEGNEVWSRDLGRWVSQHGFGASPILFEDLVILHNSQQANQLDPGVEPGISAMMAFDRRTGKEVWQTPLVSTNVCYSVPFLYEPADGPIELVCISTGNGVFSLDPRTGKKNWSVEGVFSMRTVGSPIFAGGHIFGSTGSGAYGANYVAAIKPGKHAKVAFRLKNSSKFKAPYVPSMIAHGNNVFMLYDRGFASCVDATSGEVRWSSRTGAAFSGSPILVQDRIYCMDEDGVVWVIAADAEEFRVLAKNPLGESGRSVPAVSGGRMFLRTNSHLISVGGKRDAVGG